MTSSGGWYLLIHSIPPKPLYLRAKVRQRLSRAGAVALKNSVYVLPREGGRLVDLEGIVAEIASGGGEAWISEGSFVAGVSDDEIVRRFRAERRADYAALAKELDDALASLKHRGRSEPPEKKASSRLEKLRARLAEIAAIDFFPDASARSAAAALRRLEHALRPRRRSSPSPARHADLIGKTWVTRRGVQIDRIASAWLVRRFIDANARFRFVDPKDPRIVPGEIRFDMMPGDITHEGDRCTFETLVARAGVSDPWVREIAEIVHDVDLGDGKYARPDAAGVKRLLMGIALGHSKDEDRLARGFALFDDLYGSFAGRNARKGGTR
jgi:hypothetical protein